ncbi:CBASS cGAMP-activated phospholipase [Comamonas testosteroni]|uniref:CBASS cGAMP-activated phospholipase n=1 Tax=Comamonas testosteroni TaxID=285 RepID=UPI0026ED5877|nr:CBASS cGAMP-activated phospholipase [Comamonas testosteroni]
MTSEKSPHHTEVPAWGPQRPFHILALSGGGFRGLYTATVLKHLEAQFGSPLASKFDLICGTSAGGLLALGLAAEISAADLQAMFQEQGHRIFNSRHGLRKYLGAMIMAKHSASGLQSVLEEKFGNLSIGDLRHRVLIPTVNYSKGSGQFFKTPHAPQFHLDHRHSLVDVGLATAAAPTYFPLHKLGEEGVFADGGLVGNSPGFFGLHEAHHVLKVPRAPGSARVLAIGTMTLGATKSGGSGLDWGIKQWGTALFDLVISSQEHAVDSMLKHLLSGDYVRIDDAATPDQSRDIQKLDLVTPQAIEVLTSRGTQAARRALGDPLLTPFRNHVASAPTFYHGPNMTQKGHYA